MDEIEEKVYEDLASGFSEQEAARERMLSILFSVFSSVSGKEALEIICNELCGESASCFSENTNVMAFRAGQQKVALSLRALVREAKEAEESLHKKTNT